MLKDGEMSGLYFIVGYCDRLCAENISPETEIN